MLYSFKTFCALHRLCKVLPHLLLPATLWAISTRGTSSRSQGELGAMEGLGLGAPPWATPTACFPGAAHPRCFPTLLLQRAESRHWGAAAPTKPEPAVGPNFPSACTQESCGVWRRAARVPPLTELPARPLTQHHGAAASPDAAEHEQPGVGERGRAAEQHGVVRRGALPPRGAACGAGRPAARPQAPGEGGPAIAFFPLVPGKSTGHV